MRVKTAQNTYHSKASNAALLTSSRAVRGGLVVRNLVTAAGRAEGNGATTKHKDRYTR